MDKLNGALTNLKDAPYTTEFTDCGQAYVENGYSKWTLLNIANLPSQNIGYIVESVSSGSNYSGNCYGYQKAYRIENGDTGAEFIRYRISADKTWTEWKEIALKSDLTDLVIIRNYESNREFNVDPYGVVDVGIDGIQQITGYKPIMAIYGGNNVTNSIVPALITRPMTENVTSVGFWLSNPSSGAYTFKVYCYVLYIKK